MASSPSSRRNVYTNRDYPGCMGGLMHLFDFNQALAGRKLLTDKKSGSGVEVPRNSFDVGGSIPEVPKSNVVEVPYGYEVQKASATRRLNGMPIKVLIAEELSKESDNKNRAPSVVARLMGLDALPTDSKVLQKPGKLDDKFTHTLVGDRQHGEEILPAGNVRLYAKKSKASVVSAQYPSKSVVRPQRSDYEDGKESLPFRNHPQEQQLQEFKKEFEAWQSQKSRGYSKRIEDVHTQMTDKHALLRENRHETKLALPQESFASAKLNASQETLHESREFQDALDFLQSNKEFFVRFLHEPNSLFARHLKDQESRSFSPPETVEAMKPHRSYRVPDASEASRVPSSVKESSVPRRNYKMNIAKSPGGDAMVERSASSMPQSPSIGSEESLRLQDRHRHSFSPMASQNRPRIVDCQIPTRIVVLKPSPGRVRNLKSVSPVYSRSPKDTFANDVFREDSTDVLERLREKLRGESHGEYKQEMRNMQLNASGQYKDTSKDPREIAREIARQVRENITRDLMVDSRIKNVYSTAKGTVEGRNTTQASGFYDAVASDPEAFAPGSRSFWDRSPFVSGPTEKNHGTEGLHGSKEKINVLEQLRTRSTRVSEGSISLGHDMVMKSGVTFKESSRQISPGSKTSRSVKGSGRYNVDGFFSGQPHQRALFQKDTIQAEDTIRSDPIEYKEQIKARSPKTLLKSCSDGLASSCDKSQAELQVHEASRDATEVGSESAVAEWRRPSDVGGAHSMNSTTSCQESMDLSGNLAREVEECTISVIEETSGLQPIDETVVILMEQHHAGDTSLSLGASSSTTELSYIMDCKDGTGLLAGDTNMKALAEQECRKADPTPNPQATEAVHFDNDATISLKDAAASAQSASLSCASNSTANLNSEPVKERPEQPSPVSVLDAAFEDEASVSTEFKELSSDLEELRMRLQLLKFDNDDHELELDADVHAHGFSLPAEDFESKDYDDLSQMNEDDGSVNDLDNFESTMEEMTPSSGKESEMLYVRDVLVASGFTRDNATLLTRWYAPSQPLNPSLFQKLKRSYSDKEKEILELDQATSKQGERSLNDSRRHLLFDCTNEVLLDILGSHINRRLWLSSSKLSTPMPYGRDLVKLVWWQVWCFLRAHSESQDTLENLVMKDLGKGGRWLDVGVETEALGLDVERAILDDLIEETLLVL